jgi:dipeptide transport system ATP-binding protein
MLLEVNDLNIFFKKGENPKGIHAVRNLNFKINAGEVLGIVGESGSGKSITNLALTKLLPNEATIIAKKIQFNDLDLINLNPNQWNKIRGPEIAMIFQDPMTALHPYLTVEYQLIETILTHQKMSKKDAINYSIELLASVGIKNPKERMKAYPFELSGGMAQRVMIAMAISNHPKLLIADEPTTALDVTIQKQILNLLKSIQEKNNMALALVTHDLGLVAEYSDRLQVMYAGEIVETGKTKLVMHSPLHPYTKGLISARPNLDKIKFKEPLPSIPGTVPQLFNRPTGCQFAPRCIYRKDECEKDSIPLLNYQQSEYRCILRKDI